MVVISSPPIKPSVFVVGGTTICQGQTSTLIGPTGFASYVWSTGAITQQLTASAAGNYTLTVKDALGCTSTVSDPVVIAINAAPAKPIVTASGPTTICIGQNVSLNAPAGFSYVRSTGADSQQIAVTQTGSYSLIVRDASGCTSAVSDLTVVTVNLCGTKDTTRPPVFREKVFTVQVEGVATFTINDLITDPDNDLNLSSLKIFTAPTSNSVSSLDANGTLTLDYKNVLFAGSETITLEVCDQANNCTRQDFTIDCVYAWRGLKSTPCRTLQVTQKIMN